MHHWFIGASEQVPLLPPRVGLLLIYSVIGGIAALISPVTGANPTIAYMLRCLGGAVSAFTVGALMMSYSGPNGPADNEVFRIMAASAGAGFAGPAGVLWFLRARGIIPPTNGDKRP